MEIVPEPCDRNQHVPDRREVLANEMADRMLDLGEEFEARYRSCGPEDWLNEGIHVVWARRRAEREAEKAARKQRVADRRAKREGRA